MGEEHDRRTALENESEARVSADPIQVIAEALGKRKLSGWQIRETRKRSHQSFLALSELECRRDVDTRSWYDTLHQRRDEKQGAVLGLSSFKITPPEMGELTRKIEVKWDLLGPRP